MRQDNVVQFRIDTPTKERLEMMARERGVTMSDLIRERVLGQSFMARGVTSTINKNSTPAIANPQPVDIGATDREVPGGESGVPAAPDFDRRVKQLRASMSLPNAERVARTELGLD